MSGECMYLSMSSPETSSTVFSHLIHGSIFCKNKLDRNACIQFSEHNANNLHQVRSWSKDWEVK